MRIVEIKAFENGAHRNQTGDFDIIPDNYAVIPENIKTPNFPFGELTAEEIDGVMTVTSWKAGIIPEEDKPETNTLAREDLEQLRADIDYIAVMTGVEL